MKSSNAATADRQVSEDRLIFTMGCRSHPGEVSTKQLRECWPQLPRNADVFIPVTDAQGKEHILELIHRVHKSREHTQTRYIVKAAGAKELFETFNASPGADIIGISLQPDGSYTAELNTPTVIRLDERYRGKPRLSGQKRKAPNHCRRRHNNGEKKDESYEEDHLFLEDCCNTSPGKLRFVVLGAPWGMAARKLPPLVPVSAKRGRRKGTTQTERNDSILDELDEDIREPYGLLPHEAPLYCELLVGEGRRLATHGDGFIQEDSLLDCGPQGQVPSPSTQRLSVERLTPATRYRAVVQEARKRLRAKAMAHGGQAFVDRAMAAVERFEQLCLEGAGMSGGTARERQDACDEYDRVLRLLYPGLMFDPHVLDVSALGGVCDDDRNERQGVGEEEAEEGLEDRAPSDELQLLRCMERRFIIWRQDGFRGSVDGKHEGQGGARPGVHRPVAAPVAANTTKHPTKSRRQHEALPMTSDDTRSHHAAGLQMTMQDAVVAARIRGTDEDKEIDDVGYGGGGGVATTTTTTSVQAGLQQNSIETMTASSSRPGTPTVAEKRWAAGLATIWSKFKQRLVGKQYGDITLASTEEGVSCALNDTVWRNGRLVRIPVDPGTDPLTAIQDCLASKRPGRLYLTDGSMPDYEGFRYPRTAPGMPCALNAAANAMLPKAVRSSRGTNLFHFLKSESTGTGTLSVFLPIGGGANLTAFHYETKRRRSYNAGCGDYIIQPIAAGDNSRLLMRVHAAATGYHSRHGQLLPLECYLEAGVRLVTHLRTERETTLCELCEQSMHAFVTFADASCDPKPLKVSCNEFDLVWELESAYHLELLAKAYSDLELLPGEGYAPDGADTWIQSPYLLKEPRTLAAATTATATAPRNKTSAPAQADSDGTAAAPWACELKPCPDGGCTVHAAAAAVVAPAFLSEKPSPHAQRQHLHVSDSDDSDLNFDSDEDGRYEEKESDAADTNGGDASRLDDDDLEWNMDVVVVRTAEKLCDVARGVLNKDSVHAWVGNVPTKVEAVKALQRLVPVVRHMMRRAPREDQDAGGERRDGVHGGDLEVGGSSNAMEQAKATGSNLPLPHMRKAGKQPQVWIARDKGGVLWLVPKNASVPLGFKPSSRAGRAIFGDATSATLLLDSLEDPNGDEESQDHGVHRVQVQVKAYATSYSVKNAAEFLRYLQVAPGDALDFTPLKPGHIRVRHWRAGSPEAIALRANSTEASATLDPLAPPTVTVAISDVLHRPPPPPPPQQQPQQYSVKDMNNDDGVPVLDCHFTREYLGELLRNVERCCRACEAPTTAEKTNIESHEAQRAFAAVLTSYGGQMHATSATMAIHPPPDLSLRALRKIWILALCDEWHAAVRRPVDVNALATARGWRFHLERLMDAVCVREVRRRAREWGVMERDGVRSKGAREPSGKKYSGQAAVVVDRQLCCAEKGGRDDEEEDVDVV